MAEVKAQQPEEVAPPSACFTQPCLLQVFHNGEHANGKNFTVSPADVEGVEDIGEWLGPKMDCVSEGMR